MSDRGKSCEASGTRDRVLEGQRSGMETEMKVNDEFYVYKMKSTVGAVNTELACYDILSLAKVKEGTPGGGG